MVYNLIGSFCIASKTMGVLQFDMEAYESTSHLRCDLPESLAAHGHFKRHAHALRIPASFAVSAFVADDILGYENDILFSSYLSLADLFIG